MPSCMLGPVGNYKIYDIIPAFMDLTNQHGETQHAHIKHFYNKMRLPMPECPRERVEHTSQRLPGATVSVLVRDICGAGSKNMQDCTSPGEAHVSRVGISIL